MAVEYDIKKLKELIASRDVQAIKAFMKENDLVIREGNIEPNDKKYFDSKANEFELKQYVQKIFLNSSYGALLNTSSTFFDFRMGSSITMTGRKVWQHLSSKANEIMTGEYYYQGECVQTGDTDSCYMCIDKPAFKKKYPNFDYSRDNLVRFADEVGDKINESFPQYMLDTFHCTEEGAKLQQAGREVVASRGLICGKKRYALMVFDKDGWRVDTHGKPGKIKIMGIQVSRSDCHKLVRDLLKKMLESVLTDGSKDSLINLMRDFGNNDWKKLNPWEKGKPQGCNKLTYYTEEYKKTGKCSVSQVKGAINWNILIDVNNDKITPKILDGNKVIVCKLKKNNSFGMDTISYPVDLTSFPQWFKSLPFAEQDMEDSIIDKTIETVFGVIGWELKLNQAMNNATEDLEDFLTFV